MLYAINGTNVSLSFMLEFPCSKNEADYEVFIIRLIFALQMGFRWLNVHRDSNFINQQVSEELVLKEIALLSYRTATQKLIKSFLSIRFEYVLKVYNKQAYALAILTWKVDVPDETVDAKIMKRALRGIAADLIPDRFV